MKIWLMFTVAIAVGVVIASPYLLLDVDSSRLDVGGGAHFTLLVVHVFTAFVALVLGPLQFVPAVRARRSVHRAIGRVYLLVGVLPSGLAAIPVALLSGRIVTQVGLTVPAVLWLCTGALAYRAARRRDFVGHRAWMMRNYALTFLAVTSRVLVPLLLLAQVGDEPQAMIPFGQAVGWIINLALAEVLIRRHGARSA